MKIRLDIRKSAQENASSFYQLAKELAKKEEGAKKAIEETLREMEGAANAHKEASARNAPARMKRMKEWYEKYRWFHTSENRLVLAGRDARQNDSLSSSFMKEDDLFFHADIQGAPATILTGGKAATEQEKKEAAQFAASHSSAWKVGAAAVDVYAVYKGQLSKHAQGGYVGAGGFAIEGARSWFRATQLKLAIGMENGVVICLPACHPKAEKLPVFITPGNFDKGKAAKKIAGILKTGTDELLLALPSGKFSIRGGE